MTSNAIVLTRRNGRRGKRSGAQKAGAVGQYASDAWSLAKRTAVGLNEIRKLINIETKYRPLYHAFGAVSDAGTLYPLSELAQGLTSTTRVGDSIRIQGLEIRGNVEINAAASNTLIRVMVFRDLDGPGTYPTIGDVLEQTGGSAGVISTARFNRRERFSILYDELFALSSGSNASATFHYSSGQNGHILYLGTTAAEASDGKGTIYVLTVSNEAANTPSLRSYSRLLFTDD